MTGSAREHASQARSVVGGLKGGSSCEARAVRATARAQASGACGASTLTETKLVALALTACSFAEVRVESTAQLCAALCAAERGDVVLLAPGKYEGCQTADIQCAAGRPTHIASADAKSPAVFTGGAQFSDVAHFELVDLCIQGAPVIGLNIEDAGSFETPLHHVTLLRVAVRDCGGRANHDGVKLSGVRDFRLEGCTVERWGRGGSAVDMLGRCC